MAPPGNELGVGLPLRLLLARSDDLVLALLDLVAYTTGFQFRLALCIRPGAALDLHTLFAQAGGPRRLVHRDPAASPDDGLRFGVEFADGRKATNLGVGPPGWRPGEKPPPIALVPAGGGGGGGGGFEIRYFVYPLPPPGPLTFAVEWPARGIPLATAECDAEPLLTAGAASERLWPGEESGGAAGSSFSFLRIDLDRSGRPPDAGAGGGSGER